MLVIGHDIVAQSRDLINQNGKWHRTIVPQRLIEAFDQTGGGHLCKHGFVGYRLTQTLKINLLKSHSQQTKKYRIVSRKTESVNSYLQMPTTKRANLEVPELPSSCWHYFAQSKIYLSCKLNAPFQLLLLPLISFFS